MSITTVENKKTAIVTAANAELKRIGCGGGFEVGLDRDGRIAAADDSGYYACANYRTLVEDLKSFESGSVGDQCYDGEQAPVWASIWNLFEA
jgi:hypothetical protein